MGGSISRRYCRSQHRTYPGQRVGQRFVNLVSALVVANRQGQERAHHGAAVRDVAVEQERGVGDLALLLFGVTVVDEGIQYNTNTIQYNTNTIQYNTNTIQYGAMW
jgi:hypothetical protein